MPPPANNSAATATVIASLPYSNVQTDIHDTDTGTTHTVWYRRTAQAGDGGLGVFAYGDASVYRPTATIWTGPDAGSLVPWPDPVPHDTAENKAVQVPVVPGDIYWIEIAPNGGDPTPAELTLSVLGAPMGSVPTRALLVNDDTGGFPAVVINADTFEVVRFVYPFAGGEAGDRIPGTGELLFADVDGDDLKLYDANFALITSIAFNIATSLAIRTQRTLGRFYVGRGTNPALVRVYSSAGAQLEEHELTGYSGITGIAANNDGTILYHNRSSSSSIERWDLAMDTPLSDLAAALAGYTATDILVLADDSIVALYIHDSTGEILVRRYDPSGSVLNTYNIAATSFFVTPPRLAYDPLDDVTFWVWFHDDDPQGVSVFQRVRASDGAILAGGPVTEFELGLYQPEETATPIGRFGISFSCQFVVLPGVAAGSSGSGGGDEEDGEIGPIAWVEEWEDDV